MIVDIKSVAQTFVRRRRGDPEPALNRPSPVGSRVAQRCITLRGAKLTQPYVTFRGEIAVISLPSAPDPVIGIESSETRRHRNQTKTTEKVAQCCHRFPPSLHSGRPRKKRSMPCACNSEPSNRTELNLRTTAYRTKTTSSIIRK
jgi:hypothetical protein